MGMGLEGDDGRAVAEHLAGGDAVVERGDEGHRGSEQRPRPLQDVAVGVVLADRAHRAMQGEVDEIDAVGGGRGQPAKQLRRQAGEVVGRQDSGAAGEGAIDRDDLDVAARVEHRERAADIGLRAAPRLQQLTAAIDLKSA